MIAEMIVKVSTTSNILLTASAATRVGRTRSATMPSLEVEERNDGLPFVQTSLKCDILKLDYMVSRSRISARPRKDSRSIRTWFYKAGIKEACKALGLNWNERRAVRELRRGRFQVETMLVRVTACHRDCGSHHQGRCHPQRRQPQYGRGPQYGPPQ
jgi:hypothetical protein